MAEITLLKIERGRVKASLTKLKTFADSLPGQRTLDEIESRLDRLKELINEFKSIDDQLVMHNVSSEFDAFEDKSLEIEVILRKHLHGKLSERSALASSNTDPLSTSMTQLIEQQKTFIAALPQSSGVKDPIKLPKVDLPTFSGDYKDWPSFKDLFESSVKNKAGLSNAMKLQFLKSALKGEAASLVKHLSVTEANFSEAWEKLVARYDKKKQIVSEYIRAFLHQPNCNQTSHSNSYVSSLRRLADTSDQIIRGIKVLGEDASHRDAWLIYILLNKVDSETRKDWAEETADEDFPNFNSFIQFLSRRCDALESFDPVSRKQGTHAIVKNLHLTTHMCTKCHQSHHIFKCPEYKAMNVQQRREFVNKNSLCFNCLTTGHSAQKCNSKFRCHYCNKSHHSSLHSNSMKQPHNQPKTQSVNHSTPSTLNPTSSSVNSTSFKSPALQPSSQVNSYTILQNNVNSFTMLPTALVQVIDASGIAHSCRILLDSGSQATFISEECVQRYTQRHLHVQAYILDKLTAPQPSRTIHCSAWHNLHNYELADPHFFISQKIDLILGADYFMQILRDGQLVLSPEIPPLQNTIFGYVLSGTIPLDSEVNHVVSFHTNISDLDNTLRKFWEVEDLPCQKIELSEEEQICESFFNKTHSVDPVTKRYVVRLPFKNDAPKLGQSLPLATSCFQSLERKFQNNSYLHNAYSEFMDDYEGLHHMERIPHNLIDLKCEHMYLPHHAVVKLSSSTTKVRVVFNGSANTSNGISLNQKLLVGPKTQRDLHEILLAFRSFKVAMIADVEKMYRQILVDSKDRDYQRIIWRPNKSEPIQHFRLTTVTYGTSAAPFLATRSLKQLAFEFKGQYPLAEKAIVNHFYVDDFLGGAADETEAMTLYHQLTTLLQQRGFPLRKWASSSTQIMKQIQSIDMTDISKTINDDSNNLKVLGLKWTPSNDCFGFDVAIPKLSAPTKRNLLSSVSRIFDPLGLISPVVIKFKILLQHLWLKNYGWDENCAEISEKWSSLCAELEFLKHIKIPRFIPTNAPDVEIHGFSDASENAYAAVAYCRAIDRTNYPKTIIIASKTRVCPIKQISIPRLELCAAVLLTRLMIYIKSIFSIPDQKCFAWTDSTVVLSWLSSPPRKWKCFVANRTSEILQSLPRSHWNYVPSAENPADLASRGASVKKLSNSSLWWNGPHWLMEDWTKCKFNSTLPEGKKIAEEKREKYVELFQLEINNSCLPILFSRFSSLSFIIQILSRCFQFIRKIRSQLQQIQFNPSWVIADDVAKAFRCCVLWVQNEAFYKEINDLKSTKQLSSSILLASLSPFIDEHGVLRVGGRLLNTSQPFNIRHPIILPKHHVFVTYLIKQLHEKYFHAGVSLLLSIIRQQYWIISCRTVVKTCISKCVTCIRHRAKLSQQLMANLPKSRVSAGRPFENVGVDFAGPLLLLNRRGRGSRTIKAYIALFVCFSTRSIHLELAGDLTSETFIACLKRFTSRRGIPTTLHSDNGTNFIGACRILSETQKLLLSLCKDEATTRFLASNSITWTFNPPSAPHFGGLWEAGVKSVKSILKKVVGNTHLIYEEMYTVLVQIEGLLNSRPLVPASDDVSCLDALTPAHFLIGQPLTSLPETAINQPTSSIRERWRVTQRIRQDFWKRWHNEYISTLQRRPKWHKKEPNLVAGDMVLVKEPNLQPTQWLLGRIKETYPGQDNLVRVATVTTATGELKRPITKLCKLPSISC